MTEEYLSWPLTPIGGSKCEACVSSIVQKMTVASMTRDDSKRVKKRNDKGNVNNKRRKDVIL